MQVFQVVPPIVRDVGDGLGIDADFCESLKVYLEYFESFAVACPVHTGEVSGSGLERCIAIKDLPWGPERFKFIPLPTTYQPIEFLRALPSVRRTLRAEIQASEHLIFSPYSLIGDWPSVAIWEANKLRRPYTIEADAVHGHITRKAPVRNSLKGWVKRTVLYPAFDASYRYCLSHSSLAIFQGQDVFNAYARYCPKPLKLNHHVPVHAGDHISNGELTIKLEQILRGNRLKICYAGRAIDLKGPLEWLDILQELARQGVKFEATWLGDGPMLEEMRQKAASLDIPGVSFAGFVSDRQTVLDALRDTHVFLFCHNALESARVLGEALACGAPLVGFETAYPADLVAEHGGGWFSAMGDVQGVARKLQELDRDREDLANMVRSAARSGRDLDRDAALRRRAKLVKEV